MRSRPAHISRDTTRRRLPPRSPRRKPKPRQTRAFKPCNLTNATPYQLRRFGNPTPTGARTTANKAMGRHLVLPAATMWSSPVYAQLRIGGGTPVALAAVGVDIDRPRLGELGDARVAVVREERAQLALAERAQA